MVTVTADAGRGSVIALRYPFAVNTSLVFGFLIDAESGIVLLHECRIAVALSAKRGNGHGLGLSDKTLPRIHCSLFVRLSGIATVTIHAGKPAASMDVVFYRSYGCDEF